MAEKDQRTKMTLSLIKNAFADMLSENRIQNISIRALCEAAGINRGTFYRHFDDIYDLLDSIKLDMLESFSDGLKPLLCLNPSPLDIMVGIFEYLKNNRDICSLTLGKNADKQFTSQLLNIGRDYFMKMYLAKDSSVDARNLDYFYSFLSYGCMGILEKWYDSGMTASPREIAQLAEQMVIQGMSFMESK